MKMISRPRRLSRRHQFATLALNISLFAGFSALPIHAQDDEDIPAGYTEEEWYDPSDWFDGDNIEPAETEWWDNLGWSDSDDDGYDSDRAAYDKNRTEESRIQARMNRHHAWSKQEAKRKQQPNQKNWNQKTAGNQKQPMKTVSFEGKVDGFKKVTLKNREGRGNEYTFARIRLQDDKTRVVSLGSRVNVSDLDLGKGDKIKVSGRNARIGGRDVLVASQIDVGDQVFRIRKANRPQAGRHVSMDGTVKESSETSLTGDPREKNLLIRLELKNGKSCVVDLGRDTTLGDLDIENGSEVRLQGESTKVNGKSLIVASEISVDGESTRLRDKSKADSAKDKVCPHCDRKVSGRYSRRGDAGSDSLEPVSRD